MTEKQKFLLASIIPRDVSDEEVFKDLKELKALVDAYGGKVEEFLIQRREVHDKGMYIGQGKVAEAAELIKDKKIDIVVLNAVVKSGQLFDIKTVLQKSNPDIKVWDRVDLILEIFSRHASTAEALLQIELAAMRHMGPRIYGMGMVLSRQTGGIGGRGIGETNTELMKRHWRDQIKKVQDKLVKLSADRERQLERRRRIGLATVSIIGYTNAGKTSLFNILCRKKKYAKNELFATLDSNVGKIYLPNLQKELLITDTIGFIKNLPTKLIDAFKSTLMETMHADILLHVIDVSDEDINKKIAVVENILYELGISNKKRIYVFNKIDAANGINRKALGDQYKLFQPQFISVRTKEGIGHMVSLISEQLTSFK